MHVVGGYASVHRLTDDLTVIDPEVGIRVFRRSHDDPVGIDRKQKTEGLDSPEQMNGFSIAVRQIHTAGGRRRLTHLTPH
jgi:hypothetical protein